MPLSKNLDVDQIKARRGFTLIGSEILAVEEVDSTNELAKRYFQNAAPEGMVFLAESQNKGKGRSGRTWHSPGQSGIYMSVLLKPDLETIQVPPLTLMAGVATVKAINEFSLLPATLKWPNDILLNGKKLGGILCELSFHENRPGVVIGIGINVNNEKNQFPEDLQEIATSLLQANGEPVDRTQLVISLLDRLDREYQTFLKEGTLSMAKSWAQHTEMFGKQIRLTHKRQAITGAAQRLDDQGRLVILTEDGKEMAFDSGEVTLRN